MKTRLITLTMAAMVAVLLPLCMGSCNNDTPTPYVPGEYHYSKHFMNDDYTERMVLDCVTSSVTDIQKCPDWLEVKADGKDDSDHPVLSITVSQSEDGREQSGEFIVKTDAGDKIFVAVSQSAYLDRLDNENAESVFNQKTWRTRTTIPILFENGKKDINLPWSELSNTNLPARYCYPNKDTVDWKLAFNTCEVQGVQNTHMFGLWDANSQLLRIYVYLTDIPDASATSYYVVVKVQNASGQPVVDPSTTGWMPTDPQMNESWSTTINANVPTPKQNQLYIPPISGNTTGTLNPGWICYELNYKGLSKVSGNEKIDFTMEALSISNIKGTATTTGVMRSMADSCFITAPGNHLKAVSIGLNAGGQFCSSIASTIANVATASQGGKYAAIATGVFGGIGALFSLAGGITDAAAAEENTTSSMVMNFNINETTSITMSSSAVHGTNLPAIGMTYSYMFGGVVNDIKKTPANHKVRADAMLPIKQLGVWNLKSSPVIYVAEDALFFNNKNASYYAYADDDYIANESNSDENLRYATFLDPSSLQLVLNDDKNIFPLDDVTDIKLVAYDFVYAEDSYTMSAEPYFNFYHMTTPKFNLTTETSMLNEVLDGDDKSVRLVECSDSELMLDPTVTPTYRQRKSICTNNNRNYIYKFGGATSEMTDELKPFNLVYSPILYVPRNNSNEYSNTTDFTNLGVVVVLQMKIGKITYAYAERFLPEIKTFKRSDIPALKTKIQNAQGQKTLDGKTVEYPLLKMQKDKAVRILDKLQ